MALQFPRGRAAVMGVLCGRRAAETPLSDLQRVRWEGWPILANPEPEDLPVGNWMGVLAYGTPRTFAVIPLHGD